MPNASNAPAEWDRWRHALGSHYCCRETPKGFSLREFRCNGLSALLSAPSAEQVRCLDLPLLDEVSAVTVVPMVHVPVRLGFSY